MNAGKRINWLSGVQSLGIALLVVLGISLLSPESQPALGAEETRNVLLFFSEDSQQPAIAILNQSIRGTFSRGSYGRIHFYSEYLDQMRLPEAFYKEQLVNLLSMKYADQKFDLIIPIGSPALRLAMEYGATLFPDTRIVFLVLDPRELQDIKLASHISGVTGSVELRSTLDLALSLQPNARQVVVVTGAARFDRYWEAIAREEFSNYRNDLKFTYLAGHRMEDLQKEVADLAEQTIVIYVSINQDGKGDFYTPSEALSNIAPLSSAPIYGVSGACLGLGIVGGRLFNYEALGARTAELGIRMLDGQQPRGVYVETLPSDPKFDVRQLRRWRISEKSLPPGSAIYFNEPSLWDVYKWQIIGIISLSLVEAVLIAVLIMQMIKRRRAQRTLGNRLRFEALLAELSASFVNLPAGEVDREVEKWLERLTKFLGVDCSSLIEYSQDGTILAITHSHTAPWVQPTAELFLNTRFPWFAERLMSGIPLALSCLPDDLPATARPERDYILQSGIKSNLVIPLTIGKSRNCALGFGSVRVARQWPAELVSRLQLIAEIIASAISRKQSEESLRQAFSEIGLLKEQLEAENVYLQEEIKLSHNFQEIIGESDSLKYVLYKVEQVAPADTTTLILGETGTGKELIARAIHHASPRKNRPLVKVNCAVLPTTLIESELFGHEKGAFTGALARKLGRFELANGGTLFLDEIGELPLELQPKLLRVLQEGEFERLGSSQTVKVDVRVIAASNRNLHADVQKGLFREDLWFRLNVYPLTLPPLRQRKGDIPLLVNYFVNQYVKKMGKHIASISPATLKALHSYSWPGNVRELANVIERAVINTQGTVLQLADKLEAAVSENSTFSSGRTLAEMEREIILQRLEETGWKIEGPNGAAKSLGLYPSTLRNRMSKLGILKAKAFNSGPEPDRPR
jgi:formate hydrogenlyase transcriptional activator